MPSWTLEYIRIYKSGRTETGEGTIEAPDKDTAVKRAEAYYKGAADRIDITRLCTPD